MRNQNGLSRELSHVKLARSILLFTLALTGCATDYQAASPWAEFLGTGGFSETRLSENAFAVSFKGNGATSIERAADFTLLRSAEVAIDHGFAYFVIINEQSDVKHSAFTTPVHAWTTTVPSVTGTLPNSSSTFVTGGQTFITAQPTTRNTIVAFVEKPQGVNLVYDAAYVTHSIRSKYHLPESRQ